MESARTTEHRPPATGVAVVIPAFNNADTIGEALESVAAQTCPVEEVFVVDDGSSDRTAEVARTAMERCRLRGSVLRQENAGPAAARNRGVAEAKGEWIAFLDADDAWLPWRVEVQMELAGKRPEVGLWCGDTASLQTEPGATVVVPYDDLHGMAGDHESKLLDRGEFTVLNPVSTSTVLVKRDQFIRAGGFDESFRGPEDYDLWMRIAACCPSRHIRRPLALYRRVDGSLSMNHEKFLPQVLMVIDKAYGPEGCLKGLHGRRKARSYQYMAASWSAAAGGRAARGLQLLLMATVTWPFSFRPQLRSPWGRTKLLVYVLRKGFGCRHP